MKKAASFDFAAQFADANAVVVGESFLALRVGFLTAVVVGESYLDPGVVESYLDPGVGFLTAGVAEFVLAVEAENFVGHSSVIQFLLTASVADYLAVDDPCVAFFVVEMYLAVEMYLVAVLDYIVDQGLMVVLGEGSWDKPLVREEFVFVVAVDADCVAVADPVVTLEIQNQ